jgi:hypothetical protein
MIRFFKIFDFYIKIEILLDKFNKNKILEIKFK